MNPLCVLLVCIMMPHAMEAVPDSIVRVRAHVQSEQIDLHSIPIHPKRDEWYTTSPEYMEDQRMAELGLLKPQQ